MLYTYKDRRKGLTTMTRKDYIKFADMIVNLLDDEKNTDLLTINNMVDEMTHVFKNDNRHFDNVRFHDYIDNKATRKLERR